MLLSLGFTLLYGICGIFNFAHGHFLILGALAGYFICFYVGASYGTLGLAIIIATLALLIIGSVIESLIFRQREGGHFAPAVTSYGLAMVIEGVILFLIGPETKNIPAIFKGNFNVGNATISKERVFLTLITIAVFVLFLLWIKYTKFGRAIRAVAAHPEAASTHGINPSQVTMVTFGISVALAGIAGILVLPMFGLTPTMGAPFAIKAFIIVVLGGVGSIPGALIGGFSLGLVEALTAVYISHFVGAMSGFALSLIILIFKPNGIMGEEPKEW